MNAPLILFGGTFDPVHRAHISGARAVSKALGNAQVHLMPNALPPHRQQPGASASQRLAMLTIATDNYDHLAVEDWELRQPGPSWTQRTLTHFRQQVGQRPLVLVIGADSFANLHRWRDWQQFSTLCHLAVLPRPQTTQPQPSVLSAFSEARADTLLSQPHGARLMLPAPKLDVSASAVRQALALRGQCPALDKQVHRFIQAHGLYNVPINGLTSSENPPTENEDA